MCFPPDRFDEARSRRLMGKPPCEPHAVDPSLARQAVLVNWMVNYDSQRRPTSREVLTIAAGEVDRSVPFHVASSAWVLVFQQAHNLMMFTFSKSAS